MNEELRQAQRALGGIQVVIHFRETRTMERAVLRLMRCHPHHFAVLPELNLALAVSRNGSECLLKMQEEESEDLNDPCVECTHRRTRHDGRDESCHDCPPDRHHRFTWHPPEWLKKEPEDRWWP